MLGVGSYKTARPRILPATAHAVLSCPVCLGLPSGVSAVLVLLVCPALCHHVAAAAAHETALSLFVRLGSPSSRAPATEHSVRSGLGRGGPGTPLGEDGRLLKRESPFRAQSRSLFLLLPAFQRRAKGPQDGQHSSAHATGAGAQLEPEPLVGGASMLATTPLDSLSPHRLVGFRWEKAEGGSEGGSRVAVGLCSRASGCGVAHPAAGSHRSSQRPRGSGDSSSSGGNPQELDNINNSAGASPSELDSTQFSRHGSIANLRHRLGRFPSALC